jgi:hypothetical protein
VPRISGNQPTLPFDRVATTLAALVIVALTVFLLIRNQPIADPALFFALRVVLSFSAAALGATIPGFLNVAWSGAGVAIRAGGALALFVLTFIYTPNLVTNQAQGGQVTISAPGGVAAGSIKGSPITVNPGPPAPAPPK